MTNPFTFNVRKNRSEIEESYRLFVQETSTGIVKKPLKEYRKISAAAFALVGAGFGTLFGAGYCLQSDSSPVPIFIGAALGALFSGLVGYVKGWQMDHEATLEEHKSKMDYLKTTAAVYDTEKDSGESSLVARLSIIEEEVVQDLKNQEMKARLEANLK
jgi:hypothetical protein